MSLEESIKQLDASIVKLNKTLLKIKDAGGEEEEEENGGEEEEETGGFSARRAAKKKKKAAAGKKKSKKKKKKRGRSSDDDEEEGGELDYAKHVKPKVLKAIATPEGKEAMRELFEEFGVTNAKNLDEEQYEEFVEKVDEIIEEHGE